ncbi:MAG: diguanylate cyclase [Tatlockia sp.]
MDDKVEKKLQELFILYTKSLPDKIQAIRNEWQELLNHWEPEQFQQFHRNVHNVCGSAGTYGYIALNKAARQLEVYIKNLLGSQTITHEQKEITSDLVSQLRAALEAGVPENFPIFGKALRPIENKRIYLLEQDEALQNNVSQSLKNVGYNIRCFHDMKSLHQTIEKKPPIALIIDTAFLDKKSIELILDLQAKLPVPIQLFCIVPNAELQPRIEAVRVGCIAFFQKPVDVFYLTQVINQKCGTSAENPYRILVLDDSESLAQYYSIILNQAGMVAHAISNPLNLLKELETFQPNLLLMDIYMPDCSGLELAAVLRQEYKYTTIPIIFLSTEVDEHKKLAAISLGVEEFLTKPVSPQHLISAVRSRSSRASILNYYTTTDSLTGLLNHASILKRLEIEIRHAKQKECPLSFIMVDIDLFKRINDTYGHPAGDLVLKQLATLMLGRLRSQDIIGRYGGEEFAIILPDSEPEQSAKIFDSLRVLFSQQCFTTNKMHYSVTFSAGVSSFSPEKDVNKMVKEADLALYKAKQAGRNQVVQFNKNWMQESG